MCLKYRPTWRDAWYRVEHKLTVGIIVQLSQIVVMDTNHATNKVTVQRGENPSLYVGETASNNAVLSITATIEPNTVAARSLVRWQIGSGDGDLQEGNFGASSTVLVTIKESAVRKRNNFTIKTGVVMNESRPLAGARVTHRANVNLIEFDKLYVRDKNNWASRKTLIRVPGGKATHTLYMVENLAGDTEVTFRPTIDHRSSDAHVLWKVEGETATNSSGTFSDGSVTIKLDPHEDNTARTFVIKAGTDADGVKVNNNLVLSEAEVQYEVTVVVLKATIESVLVVRNVNDTDADGVIDLRDGMIPPGDVDLRAFAPHRATMAQIAEIGEGVVVLRRSGKVRVFTDNRKGVSVDNDAAILGAGNSNVQWDMSDPLQRADFLLRITSLHVEGYRCSNAIDDTAVTIKYEGMLIARLLVTVYDLDMDADSDNTWSNLEMPSEPDATPEEDAGEHLAPGVAVGLANYDSDGDGVLDSQETTLTDAAGERGRRSVMARFEILHEGPTDGLAWKMQYDANKLRLWQKIGNTYALLEDGEALSEVGFSDSFVVLAEGLAQGDALVRVELYVDGEEAPVGEDVVCVSVFPVPAPADMTEYFTPRRVECPPYDVAKFDAFIPAPNQVGPNAFEVHRGREGPEEAERVQARCLHEVHCRPQLERRLHLLLRAL